MPRVGWHLLVKKAVLHESFLMIPNFVFIQDSVHLVTPLRGTSMLDGPNFSHSVLARDSRNHRVLYVIVFLPSDEIVLIELFLDVGHVSIGSKSLLLVDLTAKTLSILLNSLVFLIQSLLIELVIEDSDALGIGRIILTCRLVNGLLASQIGVDLSHELLLMLIPHTSLVVLSHNSALVQSLLVVVHRVELGL